jgi:DNA-binding LytR/AlgR family response regulator
MKYLVAELTTKAVIAWYENRQICIKLEDEREIRFPVTKNKILMDAPVEKVSDIFERKHEKNRDFFFVKTDYKIEKVFFKDVFFIEGMRDYRNIQTESRKILTLQTFGDLEKELPNSLFIRVHKSFMIALNKIDLIERNRIKIKDKMIPIGDTYKENFYKKIGFNTYGQKQPGHNTRYSQ